MSFLPNMLRMLDASECVCDAPWTHRMASQSHEMLYKSSNWNQWFTLSFIIQILVAAGSKLRTKPKKQKRNEWKVLRTHNDDDMHDVVYCLLQVSSALLVLSLSPSLYLLLSFRSRICTSPAPVSEVALITSTSSSIRFCFTHIIW